MSEVIREVDEAATEVQAPKPVRVRKPFPLGQVIVLFGALLLILAIVLPALLGPAVGNIFSNVVSNL